MNGIDSLDEQILAALQANGRLTMKALAEQVGLSSPAMIERVRRLEERGVINGYRAIINPAALGRPLTALIGAEVDRDRYDAFLTSVQEEPAIAECHRTTGTGTYIVKAHVADTTALEQLVDDLSAAGARCTTSLVLSSPVAYRAVTPPEGVATQRSRLTRRRRRTVPAPSLAPVLPPAPELAPSTTASGAEGAAAPTPKRRGRPRRQRTEGAS